MLFRLTDVRKSYSGHNVLEGVSFQINPGEKVGLVGRNGAGKTTVFRLIKGDESPDAGLVEKTNRLKLGMLQQHVDFEEDESVHTAALGAFKLLHDIEAEMRVLEARMSEDHSPNILERYSELQQQFEIEGGFEYVAKAESVLLGLNFDKADWEQKTSELSGGQKNRLGMVKLLLSDADVLLLDEPTNHLDVATVEWLEEYLFEYEGSYVIISHDRYFLDKICNRIIEIDNGKAFSYSGNYSKYAVDSQIRKEQMRREFENQKAFIQKTEAFIRKNLAGQKTKQAKSRRNMLERMDRVADVGEEQKSAGFDLKGVQRTGSIVLSAKNLSVGYPEKRLAGPFDFSLYRGDCLGVIGANGTGKSTLLKTILGQIRELSGSIQWGTKVNTGYYSQELEGLNKLNDVIGELRTVAPTAESGELRSFLAGFLFLGEDVFKKVADLSGGEKGRLALAKLIYSKSNVLVLDEPTNHLDIPSREALEKALAAFDGTIITVSHDRYFLDRIATQIFAFEEDCEVEVFNGNYTEYHNWKETRLPSSETSVPLKESMQVVETVSSGSRRAQLSKNEIRKLRESADELEATISERESELAKLSLLMSDPEVIADSDRLSEAAKDYSALEKKIANLYSEWEEVLGRLGEQD
ncbi:MAG: ABC-F family ATP-binding cassette domain-containing protein [Pyrinomonadaceae bacterium]|nr:ABC-F family ATP-binding cassette domain-containing protein [Pyrinomonadaceae bacterium]